MEVDGTSMSVSCSVPALIGMVFLFWKRVIRGLIQISSEGGDDSSQPCCVGWMVRRSKPPGHDIRAVWTGLPNGIQDDN